VPNRPAPAEGAVNKLLLHKADAVEAHAVEAHKEAAVAVGADAVAVLSITTPRQAPGTCARFFIIGPGIWACCAANLKSI